MHQQVVVETTTRVTVDQSTGHQEPPDRDYGAANAVVMIGIIGLVLVVVAVAGLFIVEVLPDMFEFVLELAHSIAKPLAIVGGTALIVWLLVSAGNVLVDALQAIIVIVTAPAWLPVVAVYHVGELIVTAIGERASRQHQSRLAEAQRPIIIMVSSQAEALKLLSAPNMTTARIIDAPAPKQLQAVR